MKQEEEVFPEEQRERERREEETLKKEQPKLTPKQRWHRAYNKIVMQLNVSTLLNFNDEFRILFRYLIR